jgi:hypothetical protein
MKSLLPPGLCLLLICAASRVTANDAASPSGTYHVGVSKVEITPEYPIRLNGFGFRREESKGVSQPIFARGLAISTSADEAPLVLLAIDSLGVRMDMVDEVARRLMDSHNVPRQNVALTFTHSHCTPKVNGACDNIFSTPIPPQHQQHIDRYTEELTDWLTEAARQAIESRRPARLSWGAGSVGFAKNRRTPDGPVDHSLPVLVVRDADSDSIRAVYVSYACHAVVLSFDLVSGDWPGYAAEMIERQHPGATALVSIGAGSDSNPLSGVVGDKVEVAEGYGLQIADEVTRLLNTDLRAVSGPIRTILNRIDLPLEDLPTREQLEELARQENQVGYNARTQLARLDRGEELITKLEYPVQTWSFGDSLCMVFLAGEVCVDYSLRLKQELDRERLWLNAYSNDFCSYIPSERLVQEGRYGGGSETPYFALPTTLKAGLEQLIVDEVHRQAKRVFER